MKRLTVSVLLTMVGYGSAHAQSIEEIVVTAQKREQGANDVGITMNVFTGEQLKDQGFATAEDMALLTPGLTVNESAATGVPIYTIRGVGSQDPYTASSSTVGLYFDEVSAPFTVMSRGLMFDVERVEVLKGPQGDLYGRNTTAGQINFVSNKPTEDFQAGITAGVGSYSLANLEGFVSGALSDTVRARVAVRTLQSSEGWQKSITRPGDELGELDTTAIRALFDFELGESANLLLNLHYVDDKSDNRANTAYDDNFAASGRGYVGLEDYVLAGGSNFGETPPWYSTGNNEAADWTNSFTSPITGATFDLRPQRDNQLAGASAKISWNISDELMLTSITAFDQFDRVEANDWDGMPANDSSNINTTDLSVFSQELRFSGGDDRLNWIAGAYYSSDEMDEYYHYFMSDSQFGLGSIPFGTGPFILSPILELDTKYVQETDSIAAFGHVEWQFLDKMRLTVGARYTSEERTWTGCTFSADDNSLGALWNLLFGTSITAGGCGTIDDDPASPTNLGAMLGAGTPDLAFHVFSDKIKTDRWMGKLTLDYFVNDDVLLYGTISNGFKSGGFNGANSNSTRQLEPIRPEILTSYEVGVKSTLADGSLQLNAAAFFYDYEDKQEVEPAVTFVGNISGLGNVDQSEITGAEIDMQWVPADGWNIHLGAAWLDSEITEWVTVDRNLSAWPDSIVLIDAAEIGAELPMAPNLQYSALVMKQWPIGNNIIDAAIEYSWTDKTTGGVDPNDATDDYGVTNLRVGYGSDDGKWRVLLWGRNITDEYYYPAAYFGGNASRVRVAGMPMTWGVSLDYRFGAY